MIHEFKHVFDFAFGFALATIRMAGTSVARAKTV